MTAIISLLVAAGAFVADYKTKEYATSLYAQGKPRSFFKGHIRIGYARNEGFILNKFDKRHKLVLAVSAAVFLMLATVYAFVLHKPAHKALRISMGLLTGGAAGNVYDRWRRGYVTDFIHASFLKKIVFNLADVFIVTGGLVSAFIYMLT